MSDAPPPRAISPLTGADAGHLFSARVLGRHPAHYYFDQTIGFIFVDRPHWLEEAYASAMAATDTGLLQRNLRNLDLVTGLLARMGVGDIAGVDIGGGHGLFVRGMRDRGFRFFWADRYAENLFARGFEAQPSRHDVAVAFEVLEHLVEPLEFLREQRNIFGFETCIVSATLFDPKSPPDRDWWYWAFESGQHISFFSEPALRWMADGLGMSLVWLRADLFAFTNRDLPPLRDGPLARRWRRVRDRIDCLLLPERAATRGSLTFADHQFLKERLLAAGRSPEPRS